MAPSLMANMGRGVQCSEMWAVQAYWKCAVSALGPNPNFLDVPCLSLITTLTYLFCRFLLLLEKISQRVDNMLKKAQRTFFSPVQWQVEVTQPLCNLVLLSKKCPDALKPFHTYFLNYIRNSGNTKHQKDFSFFPTSSKILFSLEREAFDKESLQ